MTDWAAFAGVAVAVTLLLLLLARASQAAVGTPRPAPGEVRWLDQLEDGADHLDAGGAPGPEPTSPFEASMGGPTSMSSVALLVNVTFSQGLFAGLLVAGAWYTGVPASAFGAGPESLSVAALAVGVGFGAALSLANGVAGAAASALGYDPSEDLRELLAPDSPGGWILLLFVVLPFVAGFEELLFRGALVGALHAGFGWSPWLLAVVASAAFALGHGAQGPIGVVVTGVLGFVLAAGFILTGSLLVVVVAHYLVNAVEFVVYEGFGLEPPFGP
ncbi:MAG: type II CAAX prenyl endopeptidase Rce1 family protein [Haloglomus sp.]